MAKKKNNNTQQKQSQPNKKTYSLIKTIRSEKLYKANIQVRDKYARKYIDENLATDTKNSIIPGQLITFEYFEPKTKEELEYYDAMPCTIFFGVHKTKEGLRVIGFNIHYYPPRMRYQVLDKIFEMFKFDYKNAWDKPLSRELSNFDFKTMVNILQKAKLDFGVRMYDPKLMNKITPIPFLDWSKVVFTEGRFKKRTRIAIMKYWSNWKSKY